MTLDQAVSAFGAAAKAKLDHPTATGQPEDQLRSPLETLFRDLAALAGVADVVLVGESARADLAARLDFEVTVGGVQAGYVEVKAPGKGSDPRRFTGAHDKDQWGKLQALPNLIYTDGNSLSLWRDGVLVGEIVHLGDVRTDGPALTGARRPARHRPELSPVGPPAAGLRRRAGPDRRPAVPVLARRGRGPTGQRQRRPGQSGPGVAAAALPPRPPTLASPTATPRPSRSACCSPGLATSTSTTAWTTSPRPCAPGTRSSAPRWAC